MSLLGRQPCYRSPLAGSQDASRLKPDASLAWTIKSAHTCYQVKLPDSPSIDVVLISTKGQIVLPVAVRTALGLKPGMRVQVKVEGKRANPRALPHIRKP
ncbi:MAG: AbrB/MazE/SpoVT family DNA-binding domain-containing protein [Rubrivivax sp.]